MTTSTKFVHVKWCSNSLQWVYNMTMRKLNLYLQSIGDICPSGWHTGPDRKVKVLSPGQGHCVVFLDKILYFHSAFLHPGV